MYIQNLFKDQIALVTGGRSGIGYAIAKMLLQYGAKVVIASRKEDLLQKAAEELSEFGECIYQVCDIRQTDQVKALGEKIQDHFGKLDILVNNAGGQFPSPAEAISENGWNAVINNNLNGTFYVISEMGKRFLIPQKNGVIINIIASIYRGFPAMVHTGAARAGVDNLTKTLAIEWGDYNIRVNAIAPGTIDSSGLDTYPKPVQDLFGQIREGIPLKRLGTVEDVAYATCFLASPMAAYITGVTLYIDGAQHLNSGDAMMLTRLLRNFTPKPKS
ncbi:MAG: SDR family oxidoreductase [Microscillaceae bacterium]|nr:SDR family oxidoreductase [Microscillaceae bacterium]